MSVTAITQSEYSRKMAHALDDRLERWRLRIESEGIDNAHIQELIKGYDPLVRDIKAIHDLKSASEAKIRVRGIVGHLQSVLSELKKKAPSKSTKKQEVELYRNRRDELKVELTYVQKLGEQVTEVSKYYHTISGRGANYERNREAATRI